MIKTVYASKVGKSYRLSEHFKLSEFQCRDGSDKVKFSTKLFEKLEELRAYGGFTVSITSGYRTATYNKKIGGASASQHTKGTAADIVVYKDGKVVNARKICCICQSLGFKGIGFISDASTHVDMRTVGTYRGDERRGYGNNVSDFYKYFSIPAVEVGALKAKPKPIKKQEEEEVTQKQFNEMMEVWLSEQGKKGESAWSKEEGAMKWAKENGITDGTNPLKPCTREQVVAMLNRLYKLFK